MAPIRVGIIGLSTSSELTDWAAKAHLPYLQSTSKYEIVALCNSSVNKAKASIEKYKLPQSTKAYGSPEDMAKDADIDLAVCIVRVQSHYELLKPLVRAGKNVFTELPLAQTIEQIRELEEMADQQGIRTIIGMQGQANPVVNVVKRIIDEGKIGKVLSSTVMAYSGQFGGTPKPKGHAHMHTRESGGNFMTIHFLHTINFILHVLGEFASFDSMLGLTHPEVSIIDPANPEKGVIETMTATSPDQVFLQGRMQSGALLVYHLEGGQAFPGEPGLRWHIVGEKGEIIITNPMCVLDIIHAGAKVMLLEKGSKEPTQVEIPANEAVDSLPHPAQNVGRLYEAFADGKTEEYADWKLGRRRHELIAEMFQRSDGEEPFGAKASYMDQS